MSQEGQRSAPPLRGGALRLSNTTLWRSFRPAGRRRWPGILITGSASSVAGISALTCLVCDPGQIFEIGRQASGPGFLRKADLGTGTAVSGSTTTNYAFSAAR